MFRATGQKSKSGKDVFVVIGIVGIEDEEVKDGFKYNLLDLAIHQGKDFSELNNDSSPEDLLEQKIWVIE